MGVLLVISIGMLFSVLLFEGYFRTRPLLLACFIGAVLLLICLVFLFVIIDLRELRMFVKEGKTFEIFRKRDEEAQNK